MGDVGLQRRSVRLEVQSGPINQAMSRALLARLQGLSRRSRNESGFDTVGVYYNSTATAMNLCPTVRCLF